MPRLGGQPHLESVNYRLAGSPRLLTLTVNILAQRKMSASTDVVVVLVTAPDLDSATRVARGLLESRLVACANLVPGIRSLFWWEGSVEESDEVLMVLKSRRSAVERISGKVRALHPYEVPEVVALDVTSGLGAYLAWVKGETKDSEG